MEIGEVTYNDIKGKKIFSNNFTIVLLSKKLTATSYFLELNFSEIVSELPKSLSIYKMNEPENEELIKNYKIQSKATLLFFVKSELREIITAPLSKAMLSETVKNLIINNS